MRVAIAVAVVAGVLTLAACGSGAQSGSTAPVNVRSASPTVGASSLGGTREGGVLAVAASNPELTTFASAVKAAGLDSTLSGKGPFTVLAPTNEAFGKLAPTGAADKLMLPCNRAALNKLLLYHVVRGDILAEYVKAGPLTTIEGSRIDLLVGGGRVLVNRVGWIVTADAPATNGVVKTIQAVLIPPNVNLADLRSVC